jgi:hypothetical protein
LQYFREICDRWLFKATTVLLSESTTDVLYVSFLYDRFKGFDLQLFSSINFKFLPKDKFKNSSELYTYMVDGT